jgi:hypothetical protein
MASSTGPTAESRIEVQLGDGQTVRGALPLTEEPTQVVRTPVGIVKIEEPGEVTLTARMIGLPLVGSFGLSGIDLEPLSIPEAGFGVPRTTGTDP